MNSCVRGICLSWLLVMVTGLVHAADPQLLKSNQDKINYAIGVETARNFRNQAIDIDPDLVLMGMRDGLAGGKLLLAESELRSILITVQSDLRRKQQAIKRHPGAGPGEKGADNLQ